MAMILAFGNFKKTDRQRTENREGQTDKPFTETPLITVPIERRVERANI